MGARELNTGAGRRTKVGMALERSAEETLVHVKGDAKLPARRFNLAESIRRRLDPLGGVELASPPREAVRRPSKIGK
jgi:N6-adenosine-specific RNA methylase IME4